MFGNRKRNVSFADGAPKKSIGVIATISRVMRFGGKVSSEKYPQSSTEGAVHHTPKGSLPAPGDAPEVDLHAFLMALCSEQSQSHLRANSMSIMDQSTKDLSASLPSGSSFGGPKNMPAEIDEAFVLELMCTFAGRSVVP